MEGIRHTTAFFTDSKFCPASIVENLRWLDGNDYAQFCHPLNIPWAKMLGVFNTEPTIPDRVDARDSRKNIQNHCVGSVADGMHRHRKACEIGYAAASHKVIVGQIR